MSEPATPPLEEPSRRPRRSATLELTVLALVSALIVLGKSLIHLPLHIPGNTGLFWMALLVIGRGVVRRPTAATLMGLVSGVLAVALAPGKEGLLVGVKYFAAGAGLDLYCLAVGDRLRSPLVAGIGGALANTAKLVASLLLSLALGIPAGFIAVGLGFAAATHVFFGALGGVVGALVLGRLDRLGLPQLEALRTTPDEAER